MRIFITGATGQIGRRIVADRLARGDHISILTRNLQKASRVFSPSETEHLQVIKSNPGQPGDWQKVIDGCDAVINLAGAGIADHRWTTTYKKTLVDSRIQSTRQVVQAIRQANHPPHVFISSSGTGYYGETPSPASEDHPPGTDFLADLCARWEQEGMLAQTVHTRVILMRFAAVLDPTGGALKQMIIPFKLFLGGPLGNGRQYFPWIHWKDALGITNLALDGQISGAVNVVSPHQVTNKEFTRVLGKVLHRPSLIPVPKLVLRLVLGKFASNVTMNQQVVPARALAEEYRFQFPQLDSALADQLDEGKISAGV